MSRVAQIVLGIVVVAVVGVASFYGGMLYGKGQEQTTAVAATATGAPGQGNVPATGQFQRGTGQDTGRQGGGMLAGEIQEITAQGLTLKDNSGKIVQIKVTDTTLIQAQATLNLADLKKGQSIMASASQGGDGTYTARSMQVVDASMIDAAASGDPSAVTPGSGFPGGGFPGGGNPGGIIIRP